MAVDNHAAITGDQAAFPAILELNMPKTPDTEGDASTMRPINSLLSPFSSRNVHLPTPQSPGNLDSYGPSISRNPNSRAQILSEDVLPTDYRSTLYTSTSSSTFSSKEMITPESSPLAMRSHANGLHAKDDKRSQSPPRKTLPTRESSPHPQTFLMPDNACDIPIHHSIEVNNVTINRKRPASPVSSTNFLPPPNSIRSTSPLSRELSEEVGGEMARIRAQLLENQMTLTREAEARRPDYLKRAKRLESPPTLDVDGKDGQRVTTAIGVMESPMKGRRLMLFQKTSDESFEESLMAGGYDRYRTDFRKTVDPGDADQPGEPQILPLVSEEELRRKNRLSAFRSSSQVSSPRSQLTPVEIEGCGRVLMKIEPSDQQSPDKLRPSKKKGSRKKKKVPLRDELKDQRTFPSQSEAIDDGPNWPDTQFPWRLRSELRNDDSKLEEEQRLRRIENFLSRDSDDEEQEEKLLENKTIHSGSGGKMYPLLAQSQNRGRGPTTISVIQSDPADARTALLSKRSIRQFSFRRSPRKSADNDSDDEILCICQGRDDGRELVQCDGCHTWYHLQCIGIRSVEDLGREEDPWFCVGCAETPPPDILPSSEPTLVPTEERLKRDKIYDPPFFHAGLNPSPAAPWSSSPCVPMTPPGRRAAGPYFSSGSSWEESSSQYDPQTPQFSSKSIRVYTTGTPGDAESFALQESPFDPTSTPSRGIRFGAPFATPKNNFWQGRGPELFNTPTRLHESISSRPFGRHSALGSEDGVHFPKISPGPLGHDVTPVGQNCGPVGRLAESPLAAKGLRRGPGGRFLDMATAREGDNS